MAIKYLLRKDFIDKVIDAHSHIGVEIKQYCRGEYPYAQTAEGIYYQQLSSDVDVNVVFPLSNDLYCEPVKLLEGERIPAKEPLSAIPYKTENQILMREVFIYCPELSKRFLPFVCVDPVREVKAQISELEKLEKDFPIYGIKVNPVGCQSHVSELGVKGRAFLEYAEERKIPFIFHATTVPNDEYSQASDIFKIIEQRPALRFCMAHSLLFNRDYLKMAEETPNVWVDTAAIKIQVDLIRNMLEENKISSSDLIDADFSDYRKVLLTLAEQYTDTIIWGSDSPAYTFFCKRKQGEGQYVNFSLKGTYEDEIKALKSLPAELCKKISNINTLDFIFGKQ